MLNKKNITQAKMLANAVLPALGTAFALRHRDGIDDAINPIVPIAFILSGISLLHTLVTEKPKTALYAGFATGASALVGTCAQLLHELPDSHCEGGGVGSAFNFGDDDDGPECNERYAGDGAGYAVGCVMGSIATLISSGFFASSVQPSAAGNDQVTTSGATTTLVDGERVEGGYQSLETTATV